MSRRMVRRSLLFVALAAGFAVAAACSSGHHGTSAPLAVDSVSPATGPVGTDVTIDGTGFRNTQGTSSVTFDGVAATVLSWSATTIHVAVPDVFPGSRTVVVTVGGKSATPQPFSVVLPSRLYVESTVSPLGKVTVFAIDSAGALTAVGSPVSTGAGADLGISGVSTMPMRLDAARRRLFVANTGSIAVFDLDGATGEPTAIPGSPFAVGTNGLLGLSVNPAGTHLFASICHITGGDNRVWSAGIASNGQLTAEAGSTATPACPDALEVTPDGSRLFVNTDGGGLLLGYDLAADGSLSAAQTITQSGNAYALAVSPANDAYSPIFNSVSATIDGFSESGSPLSGSPYSITGGTFLQGLVISRDGSKAYASSGSIASTTSSGVLALDVGVGGTIGSVASWPVKGLTTGPLAITGDGRFLFTLDTDDAVLHVLDTTDGSELPGSPYAIASSSPLGLVVTP